MMKMFRQVHSVGNQFTFSISLPGHPKFRPEELCETAADAAFYCDLFKFILVSRYKLTGNTMWNSLSPDAFKAAAYEIGLNLKDPKAVFEALPVSCQNFLLDGGHETLTEYMNTPRRVSMLDKKCSGCGLEKPPSEFQRHYGTPTGLRGDCRECERKRTIQLKYGLSPEELGRLLSEQGGACAICNCSDAKLVVDHDHASKKVRALLCGQCNSALGFLQDSSRIATLATEYLLKHGK